MRTTTPQKRVLVTGASGVVGPTLVSALKRAGFQVRALTRSRHDHGLFPPETELLRGDIRDRATLAEASEECHAIFHLAAKLHINNPTEMLRDDYESINVEGTRNVSEVSARNGARLILFSSICVYGSSGGGKPFTETSSTNPQSLYAETKLRAEDVARDIAGDTLTIMRVASVYGPRMKGNYTHLAAAIRRGWFVPVGTGTNRRTLVFDQDVATAALHCLASEIAIGKTYNVSDGRVHRFSDIIAAIARAQNKRAPKLYLPESIVRVGLSGVTSLATRFGVKLPLSEEMLDKLLEDVAVSGEMIRRELQIPSPITLDEGWRKALNRKS